MTVVASQVRDYLALTTDSTSRYSDATINSNLRAASAFLEKSTNRYFTAATTTLTYTTNGAAVVDLPAVRSVGSVTLAGATLTANETYWLIPDKDQSGVYTAIQLRAFVNRGGPWWKSVPQWFDRGLDLPNYAANWGSAGYGSLPNDLILASAVVGYPDADLPEEYLLALKVLAAWYTLRPAAVLTGATLTTGGSPIPLDELPPEVARFIEDWRIGEHSAVLLG